ncbi:SCO family protein [Campylobacter sp. MIT 12-5580]|uniref:SCO family protein n=1 Tax=Campylobacter sp. MIT 12-5580 TaxID=2040651 RepID=UPI002016EBB7|nr:SCO family protein [Campylobacter sp. MIT 12-5580]
MSYVMKKIGFLILCVVIVSIIGCFETEKKYDFLLNSEQGKVSLKDFEGKKLIVYFGFSYCPDVCPATLALISNELKKFKNNEIFLLFISLDPQRDKDIKATNEWLRYFYTNSTTLLAQDENELATLAQNYGVIYKKVPLKDSALEYSIAHSNELFLFDSKGKLFQRISDLSQKSLHNAFERFLMLDQQTNQ